MEIGPQGGIKGLNSAALPIYLQAKQVCDGNLWRGRYLLPRGGAGSCARGGSCAAVVPSAAEAELNGAGFLRRESTVQGSCLSWLSTAPRRANGLEDMRSSFSSAALLSSVSN